jgi:hypothetical protein
MMGRTVAGPNGWAIPGYYNITMIIMRNKRSHKGVSDACSAALTLCIGQLTLARMATRGTANARVEFAEVLNCLSWTDDD